MEVFVARSGIRLLLIGGVALVVLGALGFAVSVVTTDKTKDIASIGSLKLQATQTTSFVIPPTLSAGALILGVVLIGGGFYQRR
jgi:hypothetical protein